jgi:membrane protease subunit HflC
MFAIISVVIVLAAMVASAIYTVNARERVVVVRFGQVVRYDDAPGLHFKVPFIDQAHHVDSRVLTFSTERQQVLTRDSQYVVVDTDVDWRVADPLKYYLTVGANEDALKRELEPVIGTVLRDEIARLAQQDVVAAGRAKVDATLLERAVGAARQFGVDVVDARIQRIDLPADATQQVYKAMGAASGGLAKKLRAEGSDTADSIRAEADRKKTELLADAYRQGQRLRGEGDARASAVVAAAASRAPEFYSFYRSLNAYKESFKKKDDVLIVDPSADFFRYMKKP